MGALEFIGDILIPDSALYDKTYLQWYNNWCIFREGLDWKLLLHCA